MPDVSQSETSAEVKQQVNLALDHLESAGFMLAEITRPSSDGLTARLSRLCDELEQWKADVWEALDG